MADETIRRYRDIIKQMTKYAESKADIIRTCNRSTVEVKTFDGDVASKAPVTWRMKFKELNKVLPHWKLWIDAFFDYADGVAEEGERVPRANDRRKRVLYWRMKPTLNQDIETGEWIARTRLLVYRKAHFNNG